MLRESFRAGLSAVRAAGWRGPFLGVLVYAPMVAVAAVAVDLFVLALILKQVVELGLVRLLGAWRTEPLPQIPEVDDEGRRVATPRRPGPPATVADRSPATAVRNAFRLGRPAIRLTGLFLLAQFGGFVVAVVISGGRLIEYSVLVQSVTATPVAALFAAFVALAPQRVGLEGDPRVLVAAAHSVRIARTTYGLVLLLAAVEPLILVATTVASAGDDVPAGRSVAVGVTAFLLAIVSKVVVTAVSNEVYLRGARLDLPLDAVR